jgi:hypothetical protein
MFNYYAMEEQLRQRVDDLHRAAARSRLIAEAHGRPGPDADQIERPASAQYGARILRLSSFPAWSRGSSATKSTERGRL